MGLIRTTASRLRTIATMMTLPHHDQLLVGLLLLIPLVFVVRIGGWARGLAAAAGLAAYLSCLQLAYGGTGTVQRPLRAASIPGWPDLFLVPVGIAGLGVYLATAARSLGGLLR